MIRPLALTLLLLAGCTATDAQLLQALANDPNSACIKITSVWFSAVYDHNWGCESPPQGK